MCFFLFLLFSLCLPLFSLSLSPSLQKTLGHRRAGRRKIIPLPNDTPKLGKETKQTKKQTPMQEFIMFSEISPHFFLSSRVGPGRGIPKIFPFFRDFRPGGFLRRLRAKTTHNTSENCASRFRSRPGKPNQRKGQNEKFMNFAHFCEFWCFSLGKQARFTLNFCSGMPLRKVHELTFLWFGLPGPLLKDIPGLLWPPGRNYPPPQN